MIQIYPNANFILPNVKAKFENIIQQKMNDNIEIDIDTQKTKVIKRNESMDVNTF